MEILGLKINKIFEKDNEILNKTFKFEKCVDKFSSTKIPVYRLFIDDIKVKKKNNNKISYKCINCKKDNLISLFVFLRKLNSDNLQYCDNCKNNTIEKINAQKITLKNTLLKKLDDKDKGDNFDDKVNNKIDDKKNNNSKLIIIKSNKDINTKINESIELWNKQTDEFKNNYNNIYITNDEYIKNIKNKIISINNDSLILNDKWEYYYNFICYNFNKFNPVFINKEENLVIKPNYIKFKCEKCENPFITRYLKVHKNKESLICRSCAFCNATFKIETIKIKDTIIKYNSKYEKNFIDWCSEKNIEIKNGPVLNYKWNDKEYKYYVDFEIPNKKLILEFKDNHQWHRKHLENGKFEAKNKAANDWALKNKYKFEIIYPKNLTELKNKL